jgi:GNAT superfamily N-acetyltransferase
LEPLTIKAVDAHCADAVLLIARLDEELRQRYPDVKGHYAAANALAPQAVLLVGYVGGRPVACGAYRPMDDSAAEIKRMYVEPSCRGQGFARRLLADLEQRARAAGFSLARLETGIYQSEAIRLYEAAGYSRIENYGVYVGNPDSICFEKGL